MHLYQDEITNKEFKKQLYKEINLIKNDIINNTLTCDEKYHSWLNVNRYQIVPEIFETSYYYDIKITPYKYLKHMIFMCLELEKLERKSFQFFPIQTNAISRHIQIDTKDFVEEEQAKKDKMKAGKKALQGLTKEEKDKIKDNKKKLQKELAKQKRLQNKDKTKKYKK